MQQSGAARSLPFDYATSICCLWIVAGFFLDAWAHGHVPIENFFTPYHAAFYSGMLALVLVVAGFAMHHRSYGKPWRDCIPQPYHLALLGFPIFVVAGIGDLIWHSLLGLEEGVDALLSPTHQALGLGMFFLASGPIRSVLSDRARATTLIQQLPLVIGLSSWLILVHFGTAYAFDPGAARLDAPPPISPFTPDYLTALSIGYYKVSVGVLIAIFQCALVTGFALYTVARIRLRPGALTIFLLLANVPAAAAFTNDTPLLAVVIVQSLAAGVFGDAFVNRYDPDPERPAPYRRFAVLLPLTYSGSYLIAVVATGGTWWDWNVALGAWLWTGVIGFALSLIGTARRTA